MMVLPCLIFQQQMFAGLQLTFMHSFLVPSGHQMAACQVRDRSVSTRSAVNGYVFSLHAVCRNVLILAR